MRICACVARSGGRRHGPEARQVRARSPQGWQAGLMASRQPGAPVQKLTIDRGKVDPDRWPYTLPIVRHVWQHGLMLGPGATILLGDNGSGKSTLVEAIAAAWARQITSFRSDWLQQMVATPSGEDSDLHRALRIPTPAAGPPVGC